MSDDEIRAVVTRLDQLMGALRVNVDALNAILASEPEVPDGNPAPA